MVYKVKPKLASMWAMEEILKDISSLIVNACQQSEVGSPAVQKYRGTVTRYFFSTVTSTVGTFST